MPRRWRGDVAAERSRRGSIQVYGTEEQKQRDLARLARGQVFGAAAVTEARSGTDASDMDMNCRKDGSHDAINGANTWISFLDVAEWFLTFVFMGVDERTAAQARGVFIVDRGLPGVSVDPVTNKFGFCSIKTGELVLEDVRLLRRRSSAKRAAASGSR